MVTCISMCMGPLLLSELMVLARGVGSKGPFSCTDRRHKYIGTYYSHTSYRRYKRLVQSTKILKLRGFLVLDFVNLILFSY